MYLNKIEMKGFKSFADKTRMDFNNGLTCIVGPNGSGKSNITDAMRWVLGEQKVKTLRGAKMEDIIFSGTTHRKPLGMSEVSLHFNNETNFFAVDYSDVTVTRKIFRSGESEYLINNTPCRLKDVRELFLDTGIGTDGYSIIGQGKVESVLSSKKDERRQIFEEAAGIVKYKMRKGETLKKLEKTQLNLLRIEDIAVELKNRIEPLRIESEKAKKYIEYSDELKEIEINSFLNEIEKITKKLSAENEAIEKITSDIVKSKAEYDTKKEKHTNDEKAYYDIEKKHDKLNEDFYSVVDNLNQIENEASLTEEKIKNLVTNITRIELEIEHIIESKVTDVEDVNKAKENKKIVEEKLEELSKLLTAQEEKFSELSKSILNIEHEGEENKQKIVDFLNEIQRNKSSIASNSDLKERFIYRKDEILDDTKRNNMLIDEVSKDVTGLELKLRLKTSQLNELTAKRNNMLKTREASNEEKEALKQNYLDLNLKVERGSTEKRVLEGMENALEGYNYSTKSLISYCRKNNINKGVHGVVAELVSIDEKYEKAIDISLGGAVQNVVCEDESVVKSLIRVLKENKMGRVTFLPLSNIASRTNNPYRLDDSIRNTKGFIGKASELVRNDDKFAPIVEYLLGRTLIVETYDDAVTLLRNKANKMRIVTLGGELFIPGGAITGGSIKKNSSGILNRKGKIENLSVLIGKLIEDREEVKKKIQIAEEKFKVENVEYENLMTNLNDMNSTMMEEKSIISIKKSDFEKIVQANIKYKKELADIIQEIDKQEVKIDSAEEAIESIEEKIIVCEGDLKLNENQKSSYKENFDTVSEELTKIKVSVASETGKIETFENEIARITRTLNQADGNVKAKEILKKEAEMQKQNFKKDAKELNEKKTAVSLEKEKINETLEDVQKGRTAYKDGIRELEKELDILKEAIDKLNDDSHKISLSKAKYEVSLEGFIGQIEEKYEMSLEEASELKKDINIAEVSKRIKVLKNELKKFGDVNLGSIREFDEVSERYLFMKEQIDDLISAEKTLRKIIKELDETMEEKFTDTFEKVRTNFVEIFSQLFSGGTADLKMNTEESILDADIEIYAQPPGKKLQSLSLLSGGEKALTAIALLFSIFKVKPAPFCILDEIEAALDDVNVFRFANFLKKFSDTSQFIVITHRKGTMEACDALYGVTMEEYGVSKIVSVKLEDVDLQEG